MHFALYRLHSLSFPMLNNQKDISKLYQRVGWWHALTHSSQGEFHLDNFIAEAKERAYSDE